MGSYTYARREFRRALLFTERLLRNLQLEIAAAVND